MGHIPWREYGIAGPKREALVDHQFAALNEVEPFFLCIVQMAYRPALRNIAMLYQEETGLRIYGKDLEIQVRVRARSGKYWLPQRWSCTLR